jgi:Fe2+ or Zn2+ uptake regulation protein
MQESDSKMDKAMKMMKEKKMKMTPEQEKKLMQMLDEINKLFDDISTKHG